MESFGESIKESVIGDRDVGLNTAICLRQEVHSHFLSRGEISFANWITISRMGEIIGISRKEFGTNARRDLLVDACPNVFSILRLLCLNVYTLKKEIGHN